MHKKWDDLELILKLIKANRPTLIVGFIVKLQQSSNQVIIKQAGNPV
jgi:hypothetical protein